MKKSKKQTAPEFQHDALVLRVCGEDMGSANGFVWPSVGEMAIAPDWKPTVECGNGLHGWLYGQGNHTAATIGEKSKWLVVGVILGECVMLGGKVKYPRARVLFVGSMRDAGDFIRANDERARSVAVIGATLTVDKGETAAVGAYGTATAGAYGTATAGDRGTATAGAYGTATAGDRGTIQIKRYDSKANRYRIVTGYIGEDGLLPNVAYRLDDDGRFVQVEP